MNDGQCVVSLEQVDGPTETASPTVSVVVTASFSATATVAPTASESTSLGAQEVDNGGSEVLGEEEATEGSECLRDNADWSFTGLDYVYTCRNLPSLWTCDCHNIAHTTAAWSALVISNCPQTCGVENACAGVRSRCPASTPSVISAVPGPAGHP